MLEALGIRADVLFIIIFLFIFALIALIFALMSKVNKMSEAYNKFIKGANGRSLEEKFTKDFDKIDKLNEEVIYLKSKISAMEEKRNASFCKFAINKFDAFKGMGGKLSFSLCILDDNNSGFVLTSMHNSDGCYSYLKEIINGKPFIKLSDNEEKVLDEAISKYNPLSKYIGEK